MSYNMVRVDKFPVESACYSVAWFVHLIGQQILNCANDSAILDNIEYIELTGEP